MVDISLRNTFPVPPSILIISHSFTVVPFILRVLLLLSIFMSPAPHTQGLHIPLATTAACDVIPQVFVRIPLAKYIHFISSGLVSFLTSITFFHSAAFFSASSALNTTSQ